MPAGREHDVGREIAATWEEKFLEGPRGSTQGFNALVDDTYERLIKPDLDQGFCGLVWALRTQTYTGQNFAGEILNRHEVPCLASLDELLAVVRDNFNASARRTADYMRTSFGKAEVLDAIRGLAAAGGWTTQQRQRFEAFVYNLGERPETFFSEGE